jgi:hypothetical protein
MYKILDFILGILEKLLPLTMQFVYRLYMYYWLKSYDCIMAKDTCEAKNTLTKED